MMEEPNKEPEIQAPNTHEIVEDWKAKKVAPILPYQWRKGQSGNPAGRPKGKTMKEYARELLEKQTDEERQEFLHGLSKDIIWQMAEGRPAQATDITSQGERIAFIPAEIAEKNGVILQSDTNSGAKPDSEGQNQVSSS